MILAGDCYGLGMARDIIDDRLLGALHIKALTHQGFIHDQSEEHTAFQVGTLDALMEGCFDGDTTIGEVLDHGDFGIGTVQHLGGELVILDGEAFVIKADQQVVKVDDKLQTPFAVVCRFTSEVGHEIADIDDTEISAFVDAFVPDPMTIVAVKIDGSFRDLLLRSIDEQHEPFPLLSEVVKDQSEWSIDQAHGTLVGFRFPDRTAGLEIPGYHFHFLSSDRKVGGHLVRCRVIEAAIALDTSEELHVELPQGVGLGTPGVADRASIRAIEKGTRSSR